MLAHIEVLAVRGTVQALVAGRRESHRCSQESVGGEGSACCVISLCHNSGGRSWASTTEIKQGGTQGYTSLGEIM